MQVAILVGGLATRLRPLTNKIPKSLIQIRGKPFLEYQLDFLEKGGVKNVILCVGYLGDEIKTFFGNGKRFGINIKYSYESQHLLGTAGALRNAKELLEDEFFVMYGDSYLFLDFIAANSYFKRFDNLGLMVVYKNYDRYDTSNVAIKDNLVKRYNKREKAKDMVYIDYGMSILKKKAIELVPKNRAYSLGELFTELIKKEELLAYEVNKRFYQIGSPEGLAEFKRYILQSEVTQ